MQIHPAPLNKTNQSVALLVRREDKPDLLVLVRRPSYDSELPDVWGLPAAILLEGETINEAARRIATQKLGVSIRVGVPLARGQQQRGGDLLEMTLCAAWTQSDTMKMPDTIRDEKVTQYVEWRWGLVQDVNDAAQQGSLCSRLLLGLSGSDVEGACV